MVWHFPFAADIWLHMRMVDPIKDFDVHNVFYLPGGSEYEKDFEKHIPWTIVLIWDWKSLIGEHVLVILLQNVFLVNWLQWALPPSHAHIQPYSPVWCWISKNGWKALNVLGMGTIAARSATEEFSIWNRGNCWKAWNIRVIGTIVARSAAENSDFGTVKMLKSMECLGNWDNCGVKRYGNFATLEQWNSWKAFDI